MHLQAALDSVIQLQELQRITVAVAVHLGTAVQLLGLVQEVLAAAGKEQTEIVAQLMVEMEPQIKAAEAAEATTERSVATVVLAL